MIPFIRRDKRFKSYRVENAGTRYLENYVPIDPIESEIFCILQILKTSKKSRVGTSHNLGIRTYIKRSIASWRAHSRSDRLTSASELSTAFDDLAHAKSNSSCMRTLLSQTAVLKTCSWVATVKQNFF